MRPAKYFIALLLVLTISFLGCSKKNPVEPKPPVYERGDVISSSSLGVYTPDIIKLILTTQNIDVPIQLNQQVEAVRVVYQTIDVQGQEVQASGALAVPINQANLPVVSIQHGTQTKRDLVASVSPINSPEGVEGLILASMGYMSCIVDYLGYGVSETMHPYIHAKSLATSVIDFIRATKKYCNDKDITLNGQLFLAGYSEGGYATLATQKEIEANYSSEFSITAVAPMAGPYDLAGTMQDVFQHGEYSSPAYIAFIFTAYDFIYGWDRLNDVFKSPYASKMNTLFDGTKSWGEVVGELPGTFTELMNPTFVANVLDGSEPDVIAAIEENTLLNWKPVAPIRFFHGNADEVAPYQNAVSAVDNLKSAGGTNIELITIEDGTHETAGIPSLIGMIEWFNTFETTDILAKADH